MVVNFRARRISRDARKLTRTPTLKKKKKFDVRHPYSHCFVVSIKHPFLFIALKRGTSNKKKKKLIFH
jgi:CRISPR/Cas system endoribonuclease Cas6 (RAMP superfamily)